MPNREEALEAAIERLTGLIARVADEEIADLVGERKAMRAELEMLRRAKAHANVVPFDIRKRGG